MVVVAKIQKKKRKGKIDTNVKIHILKVFFSGKFPEKIYGNNFL